MKSIEVEFTFRAPVRRTGGGTKKRIEPAPTTARITRLVALAIKIEDMVGRGELRDYADVARLGHVTRARLTQIMNLLNLAPDIQGQILIPTQGQVLPAERQLRQVASCVECAKQRRLWKACDFKNTGWIDPRIHLILNYFRRSEDPQQSTGLPWQELNFHSIQWDSLFKTFAFCSP